MSNVAEALGPNEPELPVPPPIAAVPTLTERLQEALKEFLRSNPSSKVESRKCSRAKALFCCDFSMG